MSTFRALLTTKDDEGVATRLVDLSDADLMAGDVDVAVEYSDVNYKDALAVTGTGRVMNILPLIGGIDFAGTVSASRHPDFSVGDAVVATGWDLSQKHHGGYAQRARVPGSWLVRVPAPLTTRQTMAIGTAGLTAMLSILALERGGVTPSSGQVLVTGANGGVGSVAVAVLARLGYDVVASTGRTSESDYLRRIGAAEVIDRATLSEPGRPLASARWAGAIDAVGSHTLANVLAATARDGVVAACGLAQGSDLPASVLPFILRGVTLAGIDSVEAAPALRELAWDRLATDLDPATLESMVRTVALDDVLGVARELLAGRVQGRTVVDVNA